MVFLVNKRISTAFFWLRKHHLRSMMNLMRNQLKMWQHWKIIWTWFVRKRLLVKLWLRTLVMIKCRNSGLGLQFLMNFFRNTRTKCEFFCSLQDFLDWFCSLWMILWFLLVCKDCSLDLSQLLWCYDAEILLGHEDVLWMEGAAQLSCKEGCSC